MPRAMATKRDLRVTLMVAVPLPPLGPTTLLPPQPASRVRARAAPTSSARVMSLQLLDGQLGPLAELERRGLERSGFAEGHRAGPHPVVPDQLELLVDVAVDLHLLLDRLRLAELAAQLGLDRGADL